QRLAADLLPQASVRHPPAPPMHHAPVAFLLHPDEQPPHPAIGERELLARLSLRSMSLPHLAQHLQSIPILRAQHQHLLFAHPASLPVLNRNFLLCWNRNFSLCRDRWWASTGGRFGIGV